MPIRVFCIFKPHNSQGTELLLGKEAETPLKLIYEIIEKAIGAGYRILDPSAIMSRGYPGSDADSDGMNVEDYEYGFAAICAQLCINMIDEGCLRYGIVTTGTHYIFVSIDPVPATPPVMLRYSLFKDPHDPPQITFIARHCTHALCFA